MSACVYVPSLPQFSPNRVSPNLQEVAPLHTRLPQQFSNKLPSLACDDTHPNGACRMIPNTKSTEHPLFHFWMCFSGRMYNFYEEEDQHLVFRKDQYVNFSHIIMVGKYSLSFSI